MPAKKTITKRSVVVHKSSKPVKSLYEILAKTEDTIQELSRMFMESGDSSHKGVRGMAKLTTSQKMIEKQLTLAQKRADKILKLIEND